MAHYSRTRFLQDCIDRRRFVVEPYQMEMIVYPVDRPQQLHLGHSPSGTIPEGHPEAFFGELRDVLCGRVLETADGERPAESMSEVHHHGVDEFGLTVIGDAGDYGHLTGPDRHIFIERAPSSGMSAGAAIAIERQRIV